MFLNSRAHPFGKARFFPCEVVVQVLDQVQQHQPLQSAGYEEGHDEGGEAVQQEVGADAHQVAAWQHADAEEDGSVSQHVVRLQYEEQHGHHVPQAHLHGPLVLSSHSKKLHATTHT